MKMSKASAVKTKKFNYIPNEEIFLFGLPAVVIATPQTLLVAYPPKNDTFGDESGDMLDSTSAR